MKSHAPHANRLSADVVDFLRRDGALVRFTEGEVIVGRGEPGRAFWVVLEGMVEVRLSAEDGVHLPLARFGPSAFFGEMALITGDPVSADVVALSPVRLLRYPADRFSGALGECAPLRTQIMSGLVQNLRATSRDVWNFSQRAKALDVLRSARAGAGPLVAESASMRKVRDRIEALAGGEGPVLVCGDPGTGKHFAAARIHDASHGASAPLVSVDCRALEEGEAVRFLFGSESFLPEGRPDDDGLRLYGAVQLAHRGTLVLRHADALPPAAQETLARYVGIVAAGQIPYPQARVVLTADGDPARFAGNPGVHGELSAAVRERAVTLPRLVERRRDIVPLARHFLEAKDPGKRLAPSAEHILVSLRCGRRNVAELREAVEMSAVFAEDDRIEAEHVIAGPKTEGGVHELDLGQFPLVRRLTSPRALGAARAAVLAAFALITAASLLRPETGAGELANALTWGLWEPSLFVLFLFVGRVWCAACPLSTAGRLAARTGGLGNHPGSWIKRRSAWLIVAGFVAIILSEHAWDMTHRPRAAGLLLLALFATAIGFALVFRRETWCRYLCPLGNLGAVFSLPAVLSVRAKPAVCATYCTTHECFKGSRDMPGCPVFHHPLYAADAHHCKLCMQCLRVCPHGSARLVLRAPLQSVWAQGDVGAGLVPFALFLFFFAPAMLAMQGTSWASTAPGALAATGAAIALAALAVPLLPRLLLRGADPDPAVATRVSFSLLILAWGPAMSYQLAHIRALDALRFHAEPGTALALFLPNQEVSLLLVSQLGTTLFAALAAAVCLVGVRLSARRAGLDLSRPGWWAVAALCGAYLAATAALLLFQGA